MYEIHGWFGLAESTEETDQGGLAGIVGRLRHDIAEHTWPSLAITLDALNGQYVLTISANPNRRRDEAEFVHALVEFIRVNLPGSWGILYERDDEAHQPPGPNAYKVTVLARGNLTEHADPFLSPANPTIED